MKIPSFVVGNTFMFEDFAKDMMEQTTKTKCVPCIQESDICVESDFKLNAGCWQTCLITAGKNSFLKLLIGLVHELFGRRDGTPCPKTTSCKIRIGLFTCGKRQKVSSAHFTRRQGKHLLEYAGECRFRFVPNLIGYFGTTLPLPQ